MKFQVGDRVKQEGNRMENESEEAVVTRIDNFLIYHKHDSGQEGHDTENNFKLIERVKPMSKYDELKQRIKAVTGWDKGADDILQEIGIVKGVYHSIQIAIHNIKDTSFRNIIVRVGDCGIQEAKFPYTSQCEKLTVFKQALMWLLDHSDIKKDLVGEEVKAEIEGKIYKVKVLGEM